MWRDDFKTHCTGCWSSVLTTPSSSLCSPPSGHGSLRAELERRGGKVRLMLALFIVLTGQALPLFCLRQDCAANQRQQTINRCFVCDCWGLVELCLFCFIWLFNDWIWLDLPLILTKIITHFILGVQKIAEHTDWSRGGGCAGQTDKLQ